MRSTYRTRRPLRNTGFDMQISSRKTYGTFTRRLFEFLDRFDPGSVSAEDRKTIAELVLALSLVEKYQPGPEQRERFRAAAGRAIDGLARSPRRGAFAREEAFWDRALRNLLVREEQIKGLFEEGKFKLTVAEGNLRDRAMAENLVWLARKYYPKEKIILWAASYHLVRNQGAIDTRSPAFDYTKAETMGDRAWQDLRDEMYVIAFTAYQGTAGTPATQPPRQGWTRELETPLDDSLEALWHASGANYAYLDFRKLPKDHWMRKPFLSRPLGYIAMLAAWPNHFDGMFYIDTIFPSTSDGAVPEGVKRPKR
jgi:erythromycin esterase